MIREEVKQIHVLDEKIEAHILHTDQGINILLAGGHKSHIGAVAVISPDGKEEIITFPTHKETIIATQWARAFYEKYKCQVVVSVGIHYDNISKAEIETIVSEVDAMLKSLI